MDKGKKYLIIGGTNKAGSTSVFEYLAEHPDVCPSFIKQANFFLDEGYNIPLDPIHKFSEEKKNYADYDKFYRAYKGQTYKLEGSPDYLYSPGTPGKVAKYVKATGHQVQFVFLLRAPKFRFKSFFQFAKQLELIPKEMELSEYMEINKRTPHNIKEPFYCILDTGHYHKFLQPYFELFGKENVHVYFFEDLKHDVKAFMKNVAQDLGLDAGFYESHNFVRHNQTRKVKNESLNNLYGNLRVWLLKQSGKSGFFLPLVRFGKKYITPMYQKMNTDVVNTEKAADIYDDFLEDVYKEEAGKLEELTGTQPPW